MPGVALMPEAGVRKLKTHASEIVRNVRERRARYVVTYRGKPVAALAPLEAVPLPERAPSGDQTHGGWDELVRLGKQVGKKWRSSLTSTELLASTRR